MLARQFASDLNAGDIVALRGDLGSGKTAFSRALIRHICERPDMEVPSPTFTLVQTYEADNSALRDIWHFDLYRLKEADEIYELGWEEALQADLCLIEWPGRIESLLPAPRWEVALSLKNSTRTISIEKMN